MAGRIAKRHVASLAALPAPAAAIAAVNLWTGWRGALPDLFTPVGMDVQSATNAALSLTASLLSLAVGIVVGIAYLMREGPRGGWRVTLAATGCGAAIVSIYASYRFQGALAEQLSFYRLDFGRIRDRLDLQSWTLLVAGSCLAALFAHGLFPAAAPPPPVRRRRPAYGRRGPRG